MNRRHGITADTYDKFVIDSGAVYKNYGIAGQQVLLGATRGGNVFKIEPEVREMEADGAKGPVKGSKRITKVVASIEANFIEISTEILCMALPGATSTTTSGPATWEQIKRALEIAATDYITNIAIVGQVSGTDNPIVCIINNALADGGLELGFADNDESVIKVTFTAHFDPSDLDTEPWEVRFPKIS